mmetsp:Transcript_24054/g.76998  ORF Transcript_24054/g.76998 Transcript_24054/m.76998 type:complete len:208 (+) Transcript_24054:205-828(+)
MHFLVCRRTTIGPCSRILSSCGCAVSSDEPCGEQPLGVPDLDVLGLDVYVRKQRLVLLLATVHDVQEGENGDQERPANGNHSDGPYGQLVRCRGLRWDRAVEELSFLEVEGPRGVQLHVAVWGAKRHLLVHGLLQPGKLFLDESRLVDGVNDGAARHDIGRGRLVGIHNHERILHDLGVADVNLVGVVVLEVLDLFGGQRTDPESHV